MRATCEAAAGDADARGDALEGLARVGLARGDDTAALTAIDRALAAAPELASAWQLRGFILLSRGAHEEAIADFESALRYSEFKRPVRSGIARALIGAGRLDEAREQIALFAGETSAADPLLHYLRASLARNDGQPELARKELLEVLQSASTHGPSLAMMAGVSFELGNYNQSLEYLRLYVATQPDDIAARLHMARIHLRLNSPDEAIAVLEEARRLVAPNAEFLATLASAHLARMDFAAATRLFEEATKLPDASDQIRTRLAATRIASGKTAAAISELEGLAKRPQSVGGRPLLLLVVGYLGRGEYVAALDAAQRLAVEFPDQAFGHNLIGVVHERAGRADAARQSYAEALKLDPNFVIASLNLARLDLVQGGSDTARSQYEAILAQTPDQPGALIALAGLALRASDGTEALRLLVRAREANPRALDPRLVLGNAYLQRRSVAAALEVAEEAHALQPNNLRVLMLLAQAQLANDKVQDAAAVGARLTALYPREPGGFLLLAVAKERLGDRAATRTALLRSLELRPKWLRALLALARLNLDERRLDDAKRFATRALEVSPNASEARLLLARAQLESGDADAGMQSLRELAAGNPGEPLAFNLLATTQERMGDLQSARTNYESALQASPDNATARVALARLDAIDGRVDSAQTRYQKSLDRVPNHPAALLGLAGIAAARGASQESLRLLEKARAENPQALEPRLSLLAEHLAAGRFEQARTVAAEALALDHPNVLIGKTASDLFARRLADARLGADALAQKLPDHPDANLLRGLVLSESGNYPEAVQALRKSLSAQPDNVGAQYILGGLLWRSGDPDGALDLARRLQATSPDWPAGYLLEGDALLMKGQPEKAVALFRTALKQGAADVGSLRLAEALWRSGDTTAAMRTLEVRLADAPQDLKSREALGDLYMMQRDDDRALSAFEHVLKSSPKHAHVLNKVALVRARADRAGALEAATLANTAAPNTPTIKDTYGWLLVENGQLDKGLDELRKAASNDQGLAPQARGTLRYHLAAATARSGDVAAARRMLDELLSGGGDFSEREQAAALRQQLDLMR